MDGFISTTRWVCYHEGLTDEGSRYLFELKRIVGLLILGEDVALDIVKELGQSKVCHGRHEGKLNCANIMTGRRIYTC